MTCPECGKEVMHIVDGRWMSEAELLALPHAPRKIERRLSHALWCTRIRVEQMP